MKESGYLEGQRQIIKQIKLIPAFNQFEDKKIEDVLRLCKIRIYDAGEVMIREGDHEKCMYFMFSGYVQIAKTGKLVAPLCRTGDVFGEMGVLDEGPRSATVRAMKETTCLAIDAQQLDKFEENENGAFPAAMYKMFAQILTHRLRATTENYMRVRDELDQIKKTAE